jgi:phage-related protein
MLCHSLLRRCLLIITSIINFITGNLPTIIGLGVELTIMLAAGLIQALPQLVASLPQIVFAIITGIGKAAVSIVEIGKNIIHGLWSGIASMLGWLQSRVNNMVNGIVRSMKGVLGSAHHLRSLPVLVKTWGKESEKALECYERCRTRNG